MKEPELNQNEVFDRFPGSDLAGEVLGLVLEGVVKSWQEAEERASLVVAVQKGDISGISRLIAGGLSPNLRRNGESLLYVALYRGQPAACAELLNAGADPNPRKAFPPLLHAAQGDLESTRLLLDCGADVNAHLGGALFNACGAGNDPIVELLLARGAKSEATTSVWPTQRREVRRVRPLMVAAWEGHVDVVRRLLAAGANRAARDSEGSTPSDWCQRCRNNSARRQVLQLLPNSKPLPTKRAR